MMQTKANGISISAGPWLILSNSLATDLSMWDVQARDLSAAFRVLRCDQRGHPAGFTRALREFLGA